MKYYAGLEFLSVDTVDVTAFRIYFILNANETLGYAEETK